MGILIVCILVIGVLPFFFRGRSIDARHPMTAVERDYWNRRCAAGDRRHRLTIIADLDDPRFLHSPAAKPAKVSAPASVETPPATPLAPATVATPSHRERAPRDRETVATPFTPDVPGLRLTAAAPRTTPAPPPEPEEAPPFTGCKDHPVTRSGYCTRCADLEDA